MHDGPSLLDARLLESLTHRVVLLLQRLLNATNRLLGLVGLKLICGWSAAEIGRGEGEAARVGAAARTFVVLEVVLAVVVVAHAGSKCSAGQRWARIQRSCKNMSPLLVGGKMFGFVLG